MMPTTSPPGPSISRQRGTSTDITAKGDFNGDDEFVTVTTEDGTADATNSSTWFQISNAQGEVKYGTVAGTVFLTAAQVEALQDDSTIGATAQTSNKVHDQTDATRIDTVQLTLSYDYWY
jgi:hypothetical protein